MVSAADTKSASRGAEAASRSLSTAPVRRSICTIASGRVAEPATSTACVPFAAIQSRGRISIAQSVSAPLSTSTVARRQLPAREYDTTSRRWPRTRPGGSPEHPLRTPELGGTRVRIVRDVRIVRSVRVPHDSSIGTTATSRSGRSRSTASRSATSPADRSIRAIRRRRTRDPRAFPTLLSVRSTVRCHPTASVGGSTTAMPARSHPD